MNSFAKSIILVIFSMFILISVLVSGNPKYFVTNDTKQQTAYGVFSEQYPGFRLDVDGSLYLDEDTGATFRIDYGTPFEGDEAIGASDTANNIWFSFAFTYTKDFSQWKYFMFAHKVITARLPSEDRSFRIQTPLGEDNGPAIRLSSEYESLYNPPEYIRKQYIDTLDWINVVSSTSSYAGPSTYDISIFKSMAFFGVNTTNPVFVDNVVFFKKFPVGIITSTTGITVPVNAPLLIGVEAIDEDGNISAMPMPTWSGTGVSKFKNTYNGLFKQSSTGDYTVNISTSIFNPDTYAWDSLVGSAGVHVVADDWKASLTLFSDAFLVGESHITKSDDGTDTTLAFAADGTIYKSGTHSIKIDYKVKDSTESWAGIYIDGQVVNINKFYNNSNSILTFWIKADNSDTFDNIEIGLKCDTKESKIKLKDLGYSYIDTNFQEIKIPLHNFRVITRDIDFTKADTYFIFSIKGINTAIQEGSIYLDEIRYLTSNALDYKLDMTIKDALGNTVNKFNWNVPNSTGWVVSENYVTVDWENYDEANKSYLEIYTDNQSLYNGKLNPSGFVKSEDSVEKTKASPLQMAWYVKSSPIANYKETLKVIEKIDYENGYTYLAEEDGVAYYPWHMVQDKSYENFVSGSDTVVLFSDTKGMHFASGSSNFAGSPTRMYLYLAANFKNAETDAKYITNLKIEKKIEN